MLALKKYLTEVVFKNGSDEFKSYRTYTKTILIQQDTESVEVELDGQEVDLKSILVEIENKYDIIVHWKSINSQSSNKIKCYLSNNDIFLKDTKLIINYTALNNATSNLYSVDYDNGILYLASETNIPLEVTYKSYNTLIKAKKANQLKEDEYKVTQNTTEVYNYDSSSPYRLVYNYNSNTDDEYTTPIISNLKVNYINTSEEETF